MDKVICIQDGVNNYLPGPHIVCGDIYHILDVKPHTEFGEKVTKYNMAPGDWYQFVELPFYHWSGLFEKLEYDEQLENEYNDKIQNCRS